MDSVQANHNFIIEFMENKIKDDLENLVKNEGVTTVILGNRRTDPYSDQLKATQRSSEGWPDFLRIHPVLEWGYHEVWRFLRFFNFKV